MGGVHAGHVGFYLKTSRKVRLIGGKVRRTRKVWKKYAWGLVAALLLLSLGLAVLDAYRASPTKIAVIHIRGEINDFGYADLARDALGDPTVKAVILDVDSSGGSVQACFETERALRMLNENKPVIVAMGEYATSGAYLVSTASDYIFARSATITGGLGVMAIWVSYENWLEKEGIRYYRWVTGPMKDLGAWYRSPTPEENEYLQELVENLLDEVVKRIKRNRPQLENVIDSLTDGSTLYGVDALALKLVDEIGSFDDAVKKAEELTGLCKGKYRLVNFN